MNKLVSLTLMCLCLMVVPAFAHVGVGPVDSFNHGFLHPLSGVDHLLAMVAVGLYAATLGGAARWLVPTAFVGTMVVGGILGYEGFALAFVEAGIAASVVVMGLAIAVGVRLSTIAAMALVGLFALFHGHAHGSEGAGLGFSFLPYAAGFIIATASLQMVGIALGLGLDRLGDTSSKILRRGAGAIGALSGIAILTGILST